MKDIKITSNSISSIANPKSNAVKPDSSKVASANFGQQIDKLVNQPLAEVNQSAKTIASTDKVVAKAPDISADLEAAREAFSEMMNAKKTLFQTYQRISKKDS